MVVPEGGSLLYMNETHGPRRPHRRSSTRCRCRSSTRMSSRCLRRARRGYTPTLIVGYGGLSGEYYWYQHTNVWENERLLTFTPREVVDARSRRRTMAPEDDFNHVLDREGGEADPRRRRHGPARRARPAPGARARTGSSGCCSREA